MTDGERRCLYVMDLLGFRAKNERGGTSFIFRKQYIVKGEVFPYTTA